MSPPFARRMHPRARTWLGLSLLCAAAFAATGWVTWLVLKDYRRRQVERRVASQAELIRHYARFHDLPESLVRAVIRIESGGNVRAVSPKGARGLMQITPITETEMLRRLKIDKGDIFDPDYNLRLGTGYLRLMIDRFQGDLVLALAAYNMGPTRTSKLRRKYPGLSSRRLIAKYAPAETSHYVRAVLAGADVGTVLPTR